MAANRGDSVPASALFQALHRPLPESAIIVDEIVAQMPVTVDAPPRRRRYQR